MTNVGVNAWDNRPVNADAVGGLIAAGEQTVTVPQLRSPSFDRWLD